MRKTILRTQRRREGTLIHCGRQHTYVTTVLLGVFHSDALKTGSNGSGGLVAGEKTLSESRHFLGGLDKLIGVLLKGHLESSVDLGLLDRGEGIGTSQEGDGKRGGGGELHGYYYSQIVGVNM